MSLESKLYQALTTSTTLTGIVSSRIYPLKMRQSGGFPSVVYRRAQGYRDWTLGGYTTLENPMVDVSLYTTGTDGRIALSDAVMDALSSSTTFDVIITGSPVDGYDDTLRVYTRTFDVSVWNRE